MRCDWLLMVQIDGPVAGSATGHRAPLRQRRQLGGGGVLMWAGIIKDELVGPFWVQDGLKINSQTYCQFLEDTLFKQWYRKKISFFQEDHDFYAGYCKKNGWPVKNNDMAPFLTWSKPYWELVGPS